MSISCPTGMVAGPASKDWLAVAYPDSSELLDWSESSVGFGGLPSFLGVLSATGWSLLSGGLSSRSYKYEVLT